MASLNSLSFMAKKNLLTLEETFKFSLVESA